MLGRGGLYCLQPPAPPQHTHTFSTIVSTMLIGTLLEMELKNEFLSPKYKQLLSQ